MSQPQAIESMIDKQDNIDFLDFLKEEVEVQQSDRHPAVTTIEMHLPTISKLSLLAKNLSVEDSQDCSRALDVTTDIRSLHKTIEELRKKATEPSRKIVQMINECAKGLQEILSRAENELKIKIASFQVKQEQKVKEAQESVKALSEQLGIDILIPGESKIIRSSKASSYYKETASFEIVDRELIPEEYWVIDEKAIQKHIDLGKRDIPGIQIVKDKKFIVRKK